MHIQHTPLLSDPQVETTGHALGKIAIAWAGLFAGVSLQEFLQIVALLATITYTVFSTWVLVRDKILRKRLISDIKSSSFGGE